jgi:hypothetical protein
MWRPCAVEFWRGLVGHPPGSSVLVDSPRFTAPLLRRLEKTSGIATRFLTYCDDVTGHEKPRATSRSAGADARRRRPRNRPVREPAEGEEPIPLAGDLLLIPPATPANRRAYSA